MTVRESRNSVLIAGLAALVALAIGILVGGRLGEAEAPGNDSAEAGFLRDMAMHHRQAVEMSLVVFPRTDDPVIRSLALDIATSQQAQVGMMSGWLDAWGLRQTGPGKAMAWMGHDLGPGERMPGLASDEDLRRLAALPPGEADILYLRLMTVHHAAGVDMANALLERSDRDLVTDFAAKVAANQSVEIETMDNLLMERGAASGGDDPGATPGAAAMPEHGRD